MNSSSSRSARIRQAARIRSLFEFPQSAPFESGWSDSIDPARLILLPVAEPGPARPNRAGPPGAPDRHIVGVDTMEAALALSALGETPCCLIFCSARRPGGGWENGAKSQEEDVSLQSSWAIQAELSTGFYQLAERGDAMNSDALLHASHGVIALDEAGQLLSSPAACSFIGFAAPNAKGLLDQGVNRGNALVAASIRQALTRRMDGVFDLALRNGAPRLILGAIGCGVFGLDPDLVAECWADSLERSQYPGGVCFAIPDGHGPIAEAFARRLALAPAPWITPAAPASALRRRG